MLFYRPRYIDVQVLADQQELIYICSMQTQDIVWKTCRDRLMIGTGGERESGGGGNLCCQHDSIIMIYQSSLSLSLSLSLFLFLRLSIPVCSNLSVYPSFLSIYLSIYLTAATTIQISKLLIIKENVVENVTCSDKKKTIKKTKQNKTKQIKQNKKSHSNIRKPRSVEM